MFVRVQQEGAQSILAQLRELEKKTRNNLVLGVMKVAAKPLADAMKARIRRKSGRTARQISVRANRFKGYVVGVSVGPLGSKSKTGRAHVARFLEFGYARKNKRTGRISHIPAYPWARPAYDSTGGKVLAGIETGFDQAFETAMRSSR